MLDNDHKQNKSNNINNSNKECKRCLIAQCLSKIASHSSKINYRLS